MPDFQSQQAHIHRAKQTILERLFYLHTYNLQEIHHLPREPLFSIVCPGSVLPQVCTPCTALTGIFTVPK